MVYTILTNWVVPSKQRDLFQDVTDEKPQEKSGDENKERGELVRKVGLFALLCRVCSGNRKPLEISIPVYEKWRR